MYHGLGKVLLEGNGAFRWLVARVARCHVSDPGAEYLSRFSMYP